MQKILWTERKFNHDLPEKSLPEVISRLKGTIVKLQYITATLNEEELTTQPGGKWSIKEHLGHLCDLEELHDGRIDDFNNRKDTLRAADMANKRTNAANHNATKLSVLLENFTGKRLAFISRLEKLDRATQSFRSLHPRLKLLMKPVDMAYFTAEHDDHHLATVRQIIKEF